MTFMTFVALWRVSLMTCYGMSLVALWRLTHYYVCYIMMFVTYDFCRLMTFVAIWCLSHYYVCHLLCLSHYYVCRIIMFAAYEVCPIMMFVTNYDVCGLYSDWIMGSLRLEPVIPQMGSWDPQIGSWDPSDWFLLSIRLVPWIPQIGSCYPSDWFLGWQADFSSPTFS